MSVDRFTDKSYLQNQQYKSAANLGARIRIHEQYSTNTYDMQRWGFDLMLATTGSYGRILEVGCGRGDLWAKNKERIPAGWHVTLSDFSPGMWADAKELVGEAGKHFEWQTVDVQELPFADYAFDTVIANFMLYHVPDRPKAIKELRRVLKPGGTLHTMTVGKQHMREMFEAIERFTPELAFDFNSSSAGFGLENGEEQLRTSFADVQRIAPENALKVTHLEALMDYVKSTTRYGETMRTALPELEAYFKQEIDEKGHFFIGKSAGAFISRGYSDGQTK
jgi:ubiquinone/menaquinone biosynthesis C-methylase UbiE